MNNKIVSALIGILIGLPISAYAAEARPEPQELLPRPTAETYRVDLPDESVSVVEQVDEEDYEAELQLLACLVEAEAGNQDLTGKRLVVDVVLNRVADPDFPDTIAGVIYQPGQFSPVTDGALAAAYYKVTQESFDAVNLELADQIDYSVRFFCGGGYGCGKPAYRYGDHYFSR